MIGGSDIIFHTICGSASLEVAVRAIARQWPNAVFEDAVSGTTWSECRSIQGADLQELLIYRDQAAARRWHDMGADESLAGTLVHLLLSPGQLTVVVDSQPGAEFQSILADIGHALARDVSRAAPRA